MKNNSLITFLCLLITGTLHLNAQDTFSIVAADSSTREVGSAGASCVDLFSAGIPDASFLGDLLPDTGAINTQAYYLVANQNNARARMREGLSPAQIINWLVFNDVQGNSTRRQYGIAGFNGAEVSSAGFTGANCDNYKNHATGSIDGIYYSIQGNILLGQMVIDSMESRFRKQEGDIACRLMAALQGAKMVGADTRCTSDGTSSLFAFVKVAQPTDAYGDPSFILTVKTHDNSHIEPIDSLQVIFDAAHFCETISVPENHKSGIILFPNPAGNEIEIRSEILSTDSHFTITDEAGRLIYEGRFRDAYVKLDINSWKSGLYTIVLDNGIYRRFVKN